MTNAQSCVIKNMPSPQSVELTVSSFSRAGIDSSMATKDGSDQSGSWVIWKSSAACGKTSGSKIWEFVGHTREWIFKLSFQSDLHLCVELGEDGGQGCASVQQGACLLHSLPPLSQSWPRKETRQVGCLLLELSQTDLGLTSLALTGHQVLHNSLQLSGGQHSKAIYCMSVRQLGDSHLKQHLHLKWSQSVSIEGKCRKTLSHTSAPPQLPAELSSIVPLYH